MSKAVRVTLITTAILVAAASLVWIGLSIGPWSWTQPFLGGGGPWRWSADGLGPSGLPGRGPGMMDYLADPSRYGIPYGMGGMGQGMMGSGMMGGVASPGLLGVEPLSIAQARSALEGYLAGLEQFNLEIGEVMIFDNHAYAQIVEADTGIGASEVLVDPVTLAVTPEHGPTMMWNLKYGAMSGFGMMGGFGSAGMRQWLGGWVDIPEAGEMPVSPEQAIESAQRYLDAYLPGAEADEHADAFYGYYTIHIDRDGQTIGMLSVNGYTKAVFVHTWHGRLIEMEEAES